MSLENLSFKRLNLKGASSGKLIKRALSERFYQRRFLVPNAITLANMFCGFLASVYAASGQFEKSALAIGFAILLDGLDGRVARHLNATSKFGLEFDSFSDLVSFGVAPALAMYHWAFKPLAYEFGVLICFVFTLCAASRLARFNIADPNLKAFVGLPTPGAAGVVAALMYALPDAERSWLLVSLATVVMPTLAYLMISKIEYFSVKLLRMAMFGLFARVLIGLIIAFLWYAGRIGFLSLAIMYCASGPFMMWLRLAKLPSDGAGSQTAPSESPAAICADSQPKSPSAGE